MYLSLFEGMVVIVVNFFFFFFPSLLGGRGRSSHSGWDCWAWCEGTGRSALLNGCSRGVVFWFGCFVGWFCVFGVVFRVGLFVFV